MTGTILSVQHYAVHDGPGIRTLVFLKGCPLRCSWCCNPECQSPKPQLRHIGFRCSTCLTCVENCPHHSPIQKEGRVVRNFDQCNICTSRVCIDQCLHEAVELSGRPVSPSDLADRVALDLPFYQNSGGGVTFSGGEPLMQPEFLLEALKACKARGIHTAIETCGWGARQTLQAILPYTDLFLFDLKLMDNGEHERHTGQPNKPILDNLAWLSRQDKAIIIRFPLVPGITDQPGNLAAVADFMNNHGLRQICLEPYHTLGHEKYNEHGMANPFPDQRYYQPSTLDSLAAFFISKGLECDIA